jgi:hypothetical protein
MVVLVLVVAVVIVAIAVLAVPRVARRRPVARRGRGTVRRRPSSPVDPGRARRTDRRQAADDRVLLAEGEEIQRRVEARLSAQGIPDHRLSGPNPTTPADRLARRVPGSPQPPGGRRARRRIAFRRSPRDHVPR